MNIPEWLQAGLWGLFAGGALMLGACLGLFLNISKKVIASIMAFGSGVLISALAFELIDESYRTGGLDSTSVGFISGAVLYTVVDSVLSNKGAKHRKRSGSKQPSEEEKSGSGAAIAAGSVLDGIPESIAIGLSLLGNATVSVATVIAVFLSNIPEGLSSSAGMKKAGRSYFYILSLWVIIALVSGISAVAGYTIFSSFSTDITAGTNSLAAGAILAMIINTMIPEAFEETNVYTGLVTVLGFLASFMLSRLF